MRLRIFYIARLVSALFRCAYWCGERRLLDVGVQQVHRYLLGFGEVGEYDRTAKFEEEERLMTEVC